MNIVSAKQRAALKRIAEGDGVAAKRAGEILNCVDRGVVPPPEAVEWFVEWIRTRGQAA